MRIAASSAMRTRPDQKAYPHRSEFASGNFPQAPPPPPSYASGRRGIHHNASKVNAAAAHK